jgi:hypothetical protein
MPLLALQHIDLHAQLQSPINKLPPAHVYSAAKSSCCLEFLWELTKHAYVLDMRL